MKRLVFLLALIAMLLAACVSADEEEFPPVPELTAPGETEKVTIPRPTNAEGDLVEIS